jgi:hypothetical protein
MPALDQSIRHVRIGEGKPLGYLGRIALEEEHRAVYRIGERTTQNKLAALGGAPSQLKVRLPKGCALRYVVLRGLIKQKIVQMVRLSDSLAGEGPAHYGGFFRDDG